jgi:hypothetical protein
VLGLACTMAQLVEDEDVGTVYSSSTSSRVLSVVTHAF